MKIVESSQSTGREISLNEIPVGQVFRGEIWGVNAKAWRGGIFYKAWGPANVRGIHDGFPTTKTADVIVVRLDETISTPGYANINLYCSTVRNYEPLDVELVVKGVQK